jgi:sulfonate transport system substrate-binding protein
MTPARPLGRAFVCALVSAFVLGFALPGAAAAEDLREIRVGFMKGGLPIVVKARHALEDHFAARGIAVKWVEFSVGPPLVEALVAGRLDFGATGNTPPIFAQSAGASLAYVAVSGPHASGAGILVAKNAPLRTLADLKGKRVGICKGSAAQNLAIVALAKAGLSYDDITPVYLSPSDSSAAFVSGQIDAWPTWDPFYTLAQKTAGARVLIDAEEVEPTYAFLLANGALAKAHPDIVGEVTQVLDEVAHWADAHRAEVVELSTAATGLPVDVERDIVARSRFGIDPVSEAALVAQQAVADRFAELKLIPKPIHVRDAVWTPPAAPVSPTPTLADTASQGARPNESR